MDGAPAASPAGNGSDLGASGVVLIPVILLIIVWGILIAPLIENQVRSRQRRETTDIEAGNPNRQERQPPQPPVNSQRPSDDGIKELGETSECVICLGNYASEVAGRTLKPCGHEFHKACIDKWLVTSRGCPICRCTVLQDSSYVSVHENRSMVACS